MLSQTKKITKPKSRGGVGGINRIIPVNDTQFKEMRSPHRTQNSNNFSNMTSSFFDKITSRLMPTSQSSRMRQSPQSPQAARAPRATTLRSQSSQSPQAARAATLRPQSPRMRQSPRATQAATLRPQPQRRPFPEHIPEEIIGTLYIYVLEQFSKEHDSKTILDNKLIENYLQVMLKFSGINKGFNASLPLPSSWKNVTIINLQNLKITKGILRVLNMTISDKITTIVLRNISFDTDKTRDDFLAFLSKNTMVEKLILDYVKVDELYSFHRFLKILGIFKNLTTLKISNFTLFKSSFNDLVTTLTLLKNLNFLNFTKNNFTKEYYTKLFTENNKNIVDIKDGFNKFNKFNIYLFKNSNSWSMRIKEEGKEEWPDNRIIDIHIDNNKKITVENGKLVKEEVIDHTSVYVERTILHIEQNLSSKPEVSISKK